MTDTQLSRVEWIPGVVKHIYSRYPSISLCYRLRGVHIYARPDSHSLNGIFDYVLCHNYQPASPQFLAN
jgi:hypothetical protein